MSYIWLCGSCMTWTRRERKNWNVDKMKKTSPPQKLQRRFSSTSICHRKWCSVISCHCVSSFRNVYFCQCILFDCTCKCGLSFVQHVFEEHKACVTNPCLLLALVTRPPPFVFVYMYQLYFWWYLYQSYFLLYKLSVKNTNERLFLALITRPPSFISNWDTH